MESQPQCLKTRSQSPAAAHCQLSTVDCGLCTAFTLIEMLIALAVVSVVTLSLYSSLRIGFKARRSAEEAIQPIEAAAAAMSIMERDLESALPPTGLLAGDFLGEDLTGETGREADYVGFHTCSGVSDVEYPERAYEDEIVLSLFENNLPQVTGGDMQKIEFLLVKDEEGPDFNLVRSVTKNLLAQVTPVPRDQVICRNVISFSVHYLDGTEWVDAWDSTQQNDSLPPAVEVMLEVRCVEPRTALDREFSVLPQERSRRVRAVFLLPCITPSSEENQFVE